MQVIYTIYNYALAGLIKNAIPFVFIIRILVL